MFSSTRRSYKPHAQPRVEPNLHNTWYPSSRETIRHRNSRPGVRLPHFTGRCRPRARAGPLARRDPRWTLREVHPESSTLVPPLRRNRAVGPSRARCKTPRPVLRSTAQGQRSGATGATRGAPDGLEHAPTTPGGVPRNRFTSVMSMVCYIAPTANTPPVFGTVFVFFQQSVRPYVAIITTQMVDVQVM